MKPSVNDLSLLVPPFLWLQFTSISECLRFFFLASPAISASRSNPLDISSIFRRERELNPHRPVQRSEILLLFLILEIIESARLPIMCSLLIPLGDFLLDKNRDPETTSTSLSSESKTLITESKEYDASASKNMTLEVGFFFHDSTACFTAEAFPVVSFWSIILSENSEATFLEESLVLISITKINYTSYSCFIGDDRKSLKRNSNPTSSSFTGTIIVTFSTFLGEAPGFSLYHHEEFSSERLCAFLKESSVDE